MAKVAETAPSLPYHEPDIITILIQSSFLLLLNLVNTILDRLVYCGLLGQVLVGIAWGTPGAKWLSIEAEEVIVQLGYLGLILLVYEGGLSTSFKSLQANLLLSSAVALTGIGIPIGLSYTLQGLLDATPLQAFAAGAALCSTSLGTTFTVLASSGLSQSRLGVVLTSAAMMDDVVGLVMVQVISNLGGGNIGAITIVRAVLVSFAFAVVVPVVCKLVVQPLTVMLNRYRKTHSNSWVSTVLPLRQTAFVLHTTLLLALVTGSSYAGTSNLFAAYIAGAVISWWDSEVPHPAKEGGAGEKTKVNEKKNSTQPDRGAGTGSAETPIQAQEGEASVQAQETASTHEETSGTAIYERYYHQAVARILQPLFFASIGFSIPITRMFSGSIVWRGLVYAILMTFAKMVCGLWLVRFPLASTKDPIRTFLSKVRLPPVPHFWGKSDTRTTATTTPPTHPQPERQSSMAARTETNSHTSPAPKPLSLHPPLILALAMTARGEIGFLISAVAESKGVFSSSSSSGETSGESDIFLVVTWAIVLCTILGPLGVGLSVRRVRKLQDRKNREREGAGRDVLGVWGVQ